jgi:tRNA threonylcarbamoyladenosine biosynthesis protein TsaB
MPIILSLDTSTDACSCAVFNGTELHERFAVIPRQHAKELLPMIQSLLAELSLGFPQLDGIAFGRGPGSFTGLRIAAGVTQGLAYAANLPVLPVSTLAALAYDAQTEAAGRPILSVIDARIDEVYWAWFSSQSGGPSLIGTEHLSAPELIDSPPLGDDRVLAVGSGLALCSRFPTALHASISAQLPDAHPRAGAIARIGAALFEQGVRVAPQDVDPLYLRDQVAKVPK